MITDDDYEMFKIVVIGSTNTGKTNIATRYIRNQFNEGQKATVGVEFLSKVVKVRNKTIKVTLWDTAGQERYKSLSKVYYKGASGVLIVYDITQPQSYVDVESWLRLANENINLDEVALMVVGNKADLQYERKVPTERATREYKDKFDIDTWEISAKSGLNVKELFAQMLDKIYDKHLDATGNASDDDASEPSVVSKKQPPPLGKPSLPIVPPQKAIPQQAIPQQAIPRQVIPEVDQSQIKPANIKRNPEPGTGTSKNATKAEHAPKVDQNQSQPQQKGGKAGNKITLNSADEKKRAKQSKQKGQGCC